MSDSCTTSVCSVPQAGTRGSSSYVSGRVVEQRAQAFRQDQDTQTQASIDRLGQRLAANEAFSHDKPRGYYFDAVV